MNVSYDFKDKVAIVIGGGSGMGKATSILLADSGAKVLVADFNEELGQKTVSEIRAKGQTAEFAYCDVRRKEDDFAAVDKAVALWGRIDYAANVVGISGKMQQCPFYEQSDEDFDNVMQTNVNGHRWLLQAETKQMMEQGGEGYAIAEVVSIQGFVGNAYQQAYTASKHAMVGLIKAVGAHYAKNGIRINGIAPVATFTDFVKNAQKSLGMEVSNKTDRVPRGTMLEPEECAQAIVWLLSEGSTAVNATTMLTDCGSTAVK